MKSSSVCRPCTLSSLASPSRWMPSPPLNCRFFTDAPGSRMKTGRCVSAVPPPLSPGPALKSRPWPSKVWPAFTTMGLFTSTVPVGAPTRMLAGGFAAWAVVAVPRAACAVPARPASVCATARCVVCEAGGAVPAACPAALPPERGDGRLRRACASGGLRAGWRGIAAVPGCRCAGPRRRPGPMPRHAVRSGKTRERRWGSWISRKVRRRSAGTPCPMHGVASTLRSGTGTPLPPREAAAMQPKRAPARPGPARVSPRRPGGTPRAPRRWSRRCPARCGRCSRNRPHRARVRCTRRGPAARGRAR